MASMHRIGARSWASSGHYRYCPLLRYRSGQLDTQILSSTNGKAYYNAQMFQKSNMSTSSKQPRIHILGVGNIARFLAHALSIGSDPPPITLLFHRPSLLSEWEAASKSISITLHGNTTTSSGYNVELTSDPNANQEPIANLILATKTLSSVQALQPIKRRLNSSSTILFTQNGMGTVDEVHSAIFPNSATRPSYLTAITSHGLFTKAPFHSVFAGPAHISVGADSQSSTALTAQTQSAYLLRKVVEAPLLNASEFDSAELKMLQLEKLVINAMINPLSVIFNCKNGELFTRAPILRLIRSLLAETSQVLSALPELREIKGARERFSEESLNVRLMDVAGKVAANTSSMLQDFRAGRETEVRYINGYIVKRGRELGVDVRGNEKVVEMVERGEVIGDELGRIKTEYGV